MRLFFKRRDKSRKPSQKFLLLITAVILCVGCRENTSHQAISAISGKWLAIKEALPSHPTGLENQIDDFCLSLDSFFSSPVGSLYQIHYPEVIQYRAAVNSAADRLKTALQKNDNTTLYLTAVEIDASLNQLQRIDNNLSDTSQRDYFFLFFLFSLLVIAIIIVLIVQYARLEKAKNRERQTLVFSREAIIAQEQERLRIARELHDTVAQDLWRLSFQTESIDKAGESAQRSKLCAEMVKGQKEVMQRVRSICDNLIPPDFQRRRFDDALRSLCYNFGQRTGIECQFVIEDKLPSGPLDGDMQLQCYRIVQECLTNIEKHAEATETSVIARRTARTTGEGELLICVSDNGRGFLPPDRHSREQLRSGGHYGLWGVYERAASIQAALIIDSEEGEGTMVTLKIPFYPEKT